MYFSKYEIDVLNVGDADAEIASFETDNGLRYTYIIDGGNPGDGAKIKGCLDKYHKVSEIDAIICTHPDKDHVGGLSELIGQFRINEVYIHNPFAHLDQIGFSILLEVAKLSKIGKNIVESFEDTINFINLVDRNKIPRKEPFAGMAIGPFTVCGPTIEYYNELISGFKDINSLINSENKINEELNDQIEDEVTECALDEKNDTTNENNSSVILGTIIEGKKLLFTGDAGVQALTNAVNMYDLSNLSWLDVPHHGSKHNLTTKLIDILKPEVSFISAKGSRKHPSQAVVNALKKHGTVYSTNKESTNISYSQDKFIYRPDYGPIEPL